MSFAISASRAHRRRPAARMAALGVVALALGALLLSLPALGSLGAAPKAGASTPHLPSSYGGGYFMGADASGGYWTTSPGGVVNPHDGATSEGSLLGVHLNKPIMGMASTPDGRGYWLVASDGGIFSFGDAAYYGSTGAIPLNKPIVGMAPTPDGRGYWLVASDGGIFSFGDAQFYGSTGAITLNKPIVGMAPTADGGGYWLVASDGGIFSYGDAQFYGSTGSIRLNKPIVAMAPTPDGQGYWMVASDGGIFTFGDAPFEGSLGSAGASVEGMIVNSSTEGYMLVETSGDAEAYGIGQVGVAVGGGASALSSVLGVYGGSGDPGAVSDFAATLGGQPEYAMDYLDATSWSSLSDPAWFLQRWGCQAGSSTCSGYDMTWSVPMLLDSGTSLAAEAAGDYDSDFTTLAQNLVAGGQGGSIIRLGWEFNGGWFPWAAGGQAANFVGAFQQIVDSMRSVSGAHFRFEWNPNIGDLGVGNLTTYYPGDAYVDYVGLDVYDGDWGTYSGTQNEFATWETETDGLNWLASFATAHGKPMVFGEWGLGWGSCSASGQSVSAAGQEVCGGDDGTFIDDMANWFATHDVYEATFWDYGTSSVDGGSNPNTAAALKAAFG